MFISTPYSYIFYKDLLSFFRVFYDSRLCNCSTRKYSIVLHTYKYTNISFFVYPRKVIGGLKSYSDIYLFSNIITTVFLYLDFENIVTEMDTYTSFFTKPSNLEDFEDLYIKCIGFFYLNTLYSFSMLVFYNSESITDLFYYTYYICTLLKHIYSVYIYRYFLIYYNHVLIHLLKLIQHTVVFANRDYLVA